MLIPMAAKPTAMDNGDEPSLNGKAGSVTAVEVTADGSCLLLRSKMSPSERISSDGKTIFLTPLFSCSRGLFLGSNACLCCLSNVSSMFRGDATEEPESHVRGLYCRVGGVGLVGQRRRNIFMASGGHGDAAGSQSGV